MEERHHGLRLLGIWHLGQLFIHSPACIYNMYVSFASSIVANLLQRQCRFAYQLGDFESKIRTFQAVLKNKL